MKNLGARLKEERERLGFSQAKFAKACGVGKTAQFNYETDARFPSGEYLFLAGQLGVDTGYLLFSERTTAKVAYVFGVANVLPFVAEKAGLNINALLWILDVAAQSEAKVWGGHGFRVEQDDFIFLVDELFCAGELLSNVIDEIRLVKHNNSISLPPEKDYSLTLMLYRASKTSGTIDKALIENSVKLAAT